MNRFDISKILQFLAHTNHDNGKAFTNRARLDAIETLLQDTPYRKLNSNGLFEAYAIDGKLPENAILVSTHVDCHRAITRCFVQEKDEEHLVGTFDNLITNAVIVSLMMTGSLNRNVVVAFTGDEEIDSRGAEDVTSYLRSKNIKFRTIILDVTDMGWNEGVGFTVENNFWSNSFGKAVVSVVNGSEYNWRFVPSDPDEIPQYVPAGKIIYEEAECDESWTYDELNAKCFSLCIPVCGNMHSNRGVLLRKKSVEEYAGILLRILNNPDLAGNLKI